MFDPTICFLCGLPPHNASETANDVYVYDCPRCGRYELARKCAINHREDNGNVRACVSAYTRQCWEREHHPARVTTDNWEEAVAAHCSTHVTEKMRKLLHMIASRSQAPGYGMAFNRNVDYPMLDASTPVECGFFLDAAKERQLIYFDGSSAGLTARGWEFIEPTGTGGIPGRCFVAMSFDPSLLEAYDVGIKPAIRTDCKMEPIRVDRQHFNEKICDRIIAEIRRCEFLVVDVTLHRQGVYFEAGFGMGLGRPVIWTCRCDEITQAHFDTRQYSHVVWDDPGDLRRKLKDRVQATIVR